MLCDVTQNAGRVKVVGLYKHFPTCAPRIPRNPRPVPRGIRGYISVMATLKVTYF
jgi:hypothetical protein